MTTHGMFLLRACPHARHMPAAAPTCISHCASRVHEFSCMPHVSPWSQPPCPTRDPPVLGSPGRAPTPGPVRWSPSAAVVCPLRMPMEHLACAECPTGNYPRCVGMRPKDVLVRVPVEHRHELAGSQLPCCSPPAAIVRDL